jgi:DNA repair protein RecO (recombination protein O)
MRIESEPGFVLHTAPYRETSLLVDLFTQHYGRIKCVAKGFRKPSKKGVSKVLFPFTEHHFQWQGRGDLKTLIKADAIQAPAFLRRESLFIGLYINEVLYRLLHQHDPHESLYQHYCQLMRQLCERGSDQVALRRFEMLLLEELGYGLVLDSEADTGNPILAECFYHYIPEHGLRATEQQSTQTGRWLKGADIIAIAGDDFEQQSALKTAKQLTRQVIDFYLDGRQLNSRELYRQHLLAVESTGQCQ